MGIMGMWRLNATVLIILIVANLTLTFAGEVIWIVVAALALLAAMYMCFRQGMVIGHDACGISGTIDRARAAGEHVFSQLDRKYLAQGFSRENGLRGVFLSALIPYAVGSIYIILTLLNLRLPATVARIAAWIISVPYWPFIMHWHESFVQLTPAIVVILLGAPFLLPLCTFAGYMQGPRLWARTEDAMKQGRRRAKARARVGKQMVPRRQKPEI